MAITEAGSIGGVIVPMVTPINADGSADLGAVDRLIDHLLTGGVHGIFLFGTTGEGLSVPRAIRQSVMAQSVKHVAGRVPVYVGVSSCATGDAIEMARLAGDAGADFVVAHVPFWSGLIDQQTDGFFRHLAEASPLPLLLYNIPKITPSRLEPACVVRLAAHPKIVGLKDSAGAADEQQAMLGAIRRTGLDGKRFPVLLGAMNHLEQVTVDDYQGIIPSSANLNPKLYADLWHARQQGDTATVMRLARESAQLGELYQGGQSLYQSLAKLKQLLNRQSLCGATLLLAN